ncbi:AgmX/PglI C-terminal domain-containing protein [Myxococcota bacterium]|nr:AgmX/PglI C-terminal domain-containing protein [Myxococcota bacterium]MBU1430890.1 AgmX/PglI C-terminal domain-containing protein [Myxococcota bacterium]MBU1899197.1 AgmX/PglI C-terminal domain-containing protein [Myxococcota bacterium]
MSAQERLRVAVLWHDTLVTEATVDPRKPVTIGTHPKNTLMIPDLGGVGQSYEVISPNGPGSVTLNLTGEMSGGDLHLSEDMDLASARSKHGAHINLEPPHWGMVDLGELAFFFQFNGEPERMPKRPIWGTIETSVLGSLLTALVLHFGVLIAAFMLWDMNASLMELDLDNNRFLDILMEEPDPPAEEEKEIPEEEDEDVGKKAGGEEGKFGEPDKIEESKVPKRDGQMVDKIKDIGVHKALNTSLMGSGALSNVFGNQDQFSDSLSAAMAGGDGPLVMGRGMGGMGMRGTGSGGGGEGFGRIHGMGRVDTGGGRGTKANLRGRKATKKKVRVARGKLGMSGFCKEKDIVRVVNARQRGIQYCYEKELARNPELSGKVTMSWRIALDGKVQKVIVEGSTLNNIAVEGCIKRNIERWSFPRPEGGMCQIRFPFVFNAGL